VEGSEHNSSLVVLLATFRLLPFVLLSASLLISLALSTNIPHVPYSLQANLLTGKSSKR
jgi:hypothetical protein